MNAPWRIIEGDCREALRAMPEGSARCCVTSPPYWGLRDYGHDGQLGLEPTPEQYVANMVEVFREVRRVLADDGTLWLNLGDSYAADRGGTTPPAQTVSGGVHGVGGVDERRGQKDGYNATRDCRRYGLKHKDLVGIPWMVAKALQAGVFFCADCEQESIATARLDDGRLLCRQCGAAQPVDLEPEDRWYLRADIIWSKPNPMPESVRDRPTKAHEYVFLLAKSDRYFYDFEAVKEAAVSTHGSGNGFVRDARLSFDGRGNEQPWADVGGLRNRRSVWNIATRPFAGAHFATMPTDLVEPCVMAGSATGDTVLDPFAGAGTVGLVANRLGRAFVGVELNPQYAAIARERITGDAPLFNTRTA